MLSYKLLWFEDRLPAEYPDLAMAAISTHDLPTVAGLWSGADFAAQQRIGVNPSEANYREIRQRLVAASGLTEDARTSEAVQKAYEALGTAPSAVLVANLDDALAVEERPNMPGTTTQWPNWSLALPVPIEDLGSAALPTAIARALRRGRIS
jgi:4-alpha-glucanotransferase